ncbi:C-type lectin domain family 4 member K isoform X2 [Ailuropoda melanoleuca]|uniref:C-type lectin domain family 4 member K isoform X2 n=1 Tax=Ailuropoda melanoleuca TaxID=9646 RepID=UPI001494F2A4|nr:C-type lectin domain family 4 member K isoform X2 [Ailuropoda melanoleuca]
MCTRKQVECQELSRENCTLLQGRNLAVLFKAEFPACRHKAWHTGISAQKESSDQRREKVAKLFPSSALLQRKSSNPRGMIHWLRFSNTGPTFSSQGQNCHAFLEPPPKTGPCLVLRKPLTVQAAVIILTLGLTASVLLQAIFYPWFMRTISDVKTNAQLLKGHVDNISTLGSEVKRNRGGVEATGIQVRMVNASLDHVRSQIGKLEAGVKKADAQIQILTRRWEEVIDLNAQIPALKRDLDKASSLNAKVRGLQSNLENISKLFKRQNDILQMVSQGWKYFKENFYYFSQIPKTWYSAQQFCMSRDSHLTSVASENEQEFLYKMAGGLFYWIGLTKAGSEGDWYWVDNTPFDKDLSARFWIPGEFTMRRWQSANREEGSQQELDLPAP